MKNTRYIVRFDDICPTMNWAVWEQIETVLERHHVRPVLAVVPDNRDPKLAVDQPMDGFWQRVRAWQARGYTIALHGYQHHYVNKNPGMLKLQPFKCFGGKPKSEFAGLPKEEQREKLLKGLEIFKQNDVRAEAWIAPSHSFDRTTIELLAELGVPIVSDGLWPHPFKDDLGLIWVPQQLWDFKDKGAGTWTVCFHHNHWNNNDLARFTQSIAQYAPNLTNVPAAASEGILRSKTLLDRFIGRLDYLCHHSALRVVASNLARPLLNHLRRPNH